MALRTLILRTSSSFFSLISARSFASNCALPPLAARAVPLLRVRPLVSASWDGWAPMVLARGGGSTRCFSTRPTTSSLQDPSPNWSNRPPKETILLDGCDFEHWLVVMEPPEGEPTRDEIIDSYIRTLAQVVGSEEEARMKIYSVSTRHYFAFGALVSEDLSYKIKALPKVRWVLPDSYLHVKEKDYGGEPFIDGKAVPYDPKYHEEWVRNNARAQERSRRNDRPRNYDRSRNYERRRENVFNRDLQNRAPPPTPNQQFQSNEAQNPMPPRDMPTGPGTHGTMPPPVPPPGNMPPPGSGMPPPGNMPPPGSGTPNPSFQGAPNRDYQNQVPAYQGNYPGTNPYQGPPAHQGGNGPYPGGGSAPQQGAGNAYQGGGGGSYQGPGGGSYQGGGAGYQGGSGGGYPGAGNPYQGGGSPYQGGGNAYQGGGGSNTYQGGGGGYPGSGSASQGGGGSFQTGGNPYQGRDMPGRD